MVKIISSKVIKHFLILNRSVLGQIRMMKIHYVSNLEMSSWWKSCMPFLVSLVKILAKWPDIIKPSTRAHSQFKVTHRKSMHFLIMRGLVSFLPLELSSNGNSHLFVFWVWGSSYLKMPGLFINPILSLSGYTKVNCLKVFPSEERWKRLQQQFDVNSITISHFLICLGLRGGKHDVKIHHPTNLTMGHDSPPSLHLQCAPFRDGTMSN